MMSQFTGGKSSVGCVTPRCEVGGNDDDPHSTDGCSHRLACVLLECVQRRNRTSGGESVHASAGGMQCTRRAADQRGGLLPACNEECEHAAVRGPILAPG